MKLSFLVIALLLTSHTAHVAQSRVHSNQSSQHTASFDPLKNLHGISQWTFAEGSELSLKPSSKSFALYDHMNTEVLKIQTPFFLNRAVFSPNKKFLLLSIWNAKEIEYSHLVVSSVKKGEITFQKYWEAGDYASEPLDHGWVAKIGALSNNGKTLLAEIAEHIGPKVRYSWQTWQLDPPRHLGTGLKVAHGKRFPKK